jgi:hypothetical protein
MYGRIFGSEFRGLLQLCLGILKPIQMRVRLSQLSMYPIVLRSHSGRLEQIRQRFLRAITVHQETAQVKERAGVLDRRIRLPGDGVTVSGNGFVNLIQAFVR